MMTFLFNEINTMFFIKYSKAVLLIVISNLNAQCIFYQSHKYFFYYLVVKKRNFQF